MIAILVTSIGQWKVVKEESIHVTLHGMKIVKRSSPVSGVTHFH